MRVDTRIVKLLMSHKPVDCFPYTNKQRYKVKLKSVDINTRQTLPINAYANITVSESHVNRLREKDKTRTSRFRDLWWMSNIVSQLTVPYLQPVQGIETFAYHMMSMKSKLSQWNTDEGGVLSTCPKPESEKYWTDWNQKWITSFRDLCVQLH